MKTHLIIAALIGMCALFCLNSDAYAQKNKNVAATHMWIQNYENLIFVPVGSLEQCKMMTKQAARFNSSEGHCYSGPKLIKEITCMKSRSGGDASCS